MKLVTRRRLGRPIELVVKAGAKDVVREIFDDRHCFGLHARIGTWGNEAPFIAPQV
jgi:hypothetical protein